MRKIIVMLTTAAVLSIGALAGSAQADHGRYYGGGWGGGPSCGVYRGGGNYYRSYRPQYYYGGPYHHHHHHHGGVSLYGRGIGIRIGF